MVNRIYPKFKEARGTAASNIDIIDLDLRVILVNSGYIYDDTHDMLDDIPGPSRITISPSMTGKTNVNGILKADPVILLDPVGNNLSALVFYINSGSESTSRLICYIDTGLGPINPSGRRITWPNGIFPT